MTKRGEAPSRDSQRSHNRATALALARGCVQENPCWPDCYESALDAIAEGNLDEWERAQARSNCYWQDDHPA